MVEHHHHQGGVVLGIVEQAVVERKSAHGIHNLTRPLVRDRGVSCGIQQIWRQRLQDKRLVGGVFHHLKGIRDGKHRVDDHRGLAIDRDAKRPDFLGQRMPLHQAFRCPESVIFDANQQDIPLGTKRLKEFGMGQLGRVVFGQNPAVLVLHLEVGDLDPHEDRGGKQGEHGWQPVTNQKRCNAKPHERVQRNNILGRIPRPPNYLCAHGKL